MVKRYSREIMAKNWTTQAKFDAWLKVELAAIKAWEKLGLIPSSDANKIVENAKFDIDEIEKIELETKHDVIAFTTSVANSLGNESRWFHYGLTSSDVIDTAVALQIRDSLKIILDDVDNLMQAIKDRAIEHKDTLMVGRSHGIHGEPITFGLSLAVWYDELVRHKQSLQSAYDYINVGAISGAMGNFAHFSPELEKYVCDELDLGVCAISTQVISRDRYAKVACALALIASSIEKFGVQIRHLQRTEVYECEEYFGSGQKGSSAMPHKKNPILSENITGLARVVRGYTIPALENVALWHERDISHSSVERFWLSDSLVTADFMLHRTTNLIKNLVVHKDNMLKNLNLTGGLVFSGKILLELPMLGVKREEAYKIVQDNAIKVWSRLKEGKDAINKEGNSLFLECLLDDERLTKHLSKDKIKQCFDYSYYTKHVDAIFNRVFQD